MQNRVAPSQFGDLRAAVSPAAPRIEVTNLTKRYLRRGQGGIIVPVDNISLSVEKNEMVVLLGPSGCGKTTLLRCIAGLERPDEGEIKIDGQVVFSSARNLFVPPEKRPVSMVFQSYALWPHMTVEQNVMYPLKCKGMKDAEANARALDVIKLVELQGLEKQYPNQISGGQQQRVAVARAVVARDGVILFDEPLSNVDAMVRDQLRRELQRMQGIFGFSGLYVTHDQFEAMSVGDRIALLNQGQVEQIDRPEVLYHKPVSRNVGTFVGNANLLEGEIGSCTETGISVKLDQGGLVLHGEGNQMEKYAGKAGKKAGLIIRPERIHLSTVKPTVATNAFPCDFVDMNFHGGFWETRFRLGDRVLRAQSLDRIDPADGKLWAHIPERHVIIVE